MRELLGGTEENSVSPMRGFHIKETEKIEFVTRPESNQGCCPTAQRRNQRPETRTKVREIIRIHWVK